MGKYVCFLAVCVVMLSSCYNDDDLKNSISGLEDRMDKLEASLQSVQTDISTLKTLTDALSQNKSIASVLENEDGSYTIKFSDKTEVTIRNGENGYLISLPEEDKERIEALRKGIVDLFKQDLEKCHSVSYEVAKDFLTCNVQEKWREAVC